MRTGIVTAVGLSLCLICAPGARAVEALSTAELKSHCDQFSVAPDGEDGIFCVRYIQGFIDGAVATDGRVAQNVADEYEKDESFTQRAARTRLGNRLSRFGPSYYAEFCLGDPVPLATVVQVVVESLADLDLVQENALARDIVYRTLRLSFPCEAGPVS